MSAGATIHFNLADGGAHGEVVERFAATFPAILFQAEARAEIRRLNLASFYIYLVGAGFALYSMIWG